MSSRIFQSVIIQMKEATDRAIGVVDLEGVIVACSDLHLIGSKIDNVDSLSDEIGEQVVLVGGKTVKFLSGAGGRHDCAVFVDGTDEIAKSLCIVASIAVSEAKMYYEEKYDKAAFIKNIISNNILPGDIYIRAKELNFDGDIPYGVFVVRQADKDEIAVVEALQNLSLIHIFI